MWVEPAFRAALAGSTLISLEESEAIGSRLLHDIVKCQHELRHYRDVVAWTGGDFFVASLSCHHTVDCKAAWTHYWWNGFARSWAHPQKPLLAAQALEEVKNEVDGICPQCKAATIALITRRRVFEAEDDMFSKALREIQAKDQQ